MPARIPCVMSHSPKNKKYSENEPNFDKLFFQNFIFCAFCVQIIIFFFFSSYNIPKSLKINYVEISIKSAGYI